MYSTALNKIVVSTLVLVFLSGCSFLRAPPPREVEITTVQIRTPIRQPVLPRAIDMKDPEWYVVSNANLDEFLVRIEKETGGVFFAMTPGDYELMSYNLQEIKRFIKEVKQVIVYYRAVTLDDDADTIQRQDEPPSKSLQGATPDGEQAVITE
jgi:hypothetical protein